MKTLAAPRNVDELDDRLSEPRPATVEALRGAPGDIVVLGAGGKMGPTLARMAARAAGQADGQRRRRVIAVSRFSSPNARRWLERQGVETIACDLLDARAVERLPGAANVVFMAGQKFGTGTDPARTWMMNVVVPAYCARRYADARIVAFSTGNVYPLVRLPTRGASETVTPAPVGEYAASCLGRERVFEFLAAEHGTRVVVLRLNYAIDLRYGVLTDIAQRIWRREPVPLAMGHVNIIWQGDANRAALELLPLASDAPLVMNVTGRDVLSVRELAQEIGSRLGITPAFSGAEAPDALLSDAARFHDLLGGEQVSVATMLDWVSEWTRAGGPLLDRATHFETRDGTF